MLFLAPFSKLVFPTFQEFLYRNGLSYIRPYLLALDKPQSLPNLKFPIFPIRPLVQITSSTPDWVLRLLIPVGNIQRFSLTLGQALLNFE